MPYSNIEIIKIKVLTTLLKNGESNCYKNYIFLCCKFITEWVFFFLIFTMHKISKKLYISIKKKVNTKIQNL